jgi:hypothetical protein
MEWIEEELTFFEFAQRFVGINDMSNPQNIDIESLGIEIETLLPNGEIGFAPMTSFIVKESVPYHWQLGELKGSGAHRVLYKNEWVPLDEHPEAVRIEEPICIVDTSVDGTQNYIANGHVNHNTVPGGKAIPFHSSVRIKLGAGQQILDKNKNVIGINVSAKTIKNKIAAPFRSCNFEIHFGRGIKEHEQVFDILRVHGPEMFGDKVVEVSGSGAWKSLTVRNLKNELLVDKKFYKAEFDQILADPELGAYCDDLLERAMVKILNSNESFDFDPDSYEEARSIVMEAEQEFVDPEA